MQEEALKLPEVLRFQQSLMNLMSQGSLAAPDDQAASSEQVQQLDAWVRQLRPQAG